MSMIKANGIKMYYEIHGEGEPLVLIEGLGYASWMWYKQVEVLSKYFRVVIFDNRGVGKTEKPDEEYSIKLFAEDTAEVLTALGIEKANILGVSMGGFIAQELAIRYPEMVNKLILCSTSFGGPNSIPIPEDTLSIMFKGGGKYNSEQGIKTAIGTALNFDTLVENGDIIDKIMNEKVKSPQPKYAYQRQLMAGASFDAEERVCRIKAETLIMAGSGDRVVPYENAKLLNGGITDSKIIIVEDSGHIFFMEKPEITNKHIIDFLRKNS